MVFLTKLGKWTLKCKCRYSQVETAKRFLSKAEHLGIPDVRVISSYRPNGPPITVLLARTDAEAKKWLNDAILEHNALTAPRRSVKKNKSSSIGRVAEDAPESLSTPAPAIEVTVIPTDEVDAETGLHRIRRGVPMSVGFDSEWKPTRSKFDKPQVSVIQLSTARSVMIIQTSSKAVTQATWEVVNYITSSKKIIKVGVGVQSDLRKISNDFGYSCRSFCDVSIATQRMYAQEKKKLLKNGLYSLVSHLLGADVKKPRHIQVSDWSLPVLCQRQIEYAAYDALMSKEVYDVLDKKAIFSNTEISKSLRNIFHHTLEKMYTPTQKEFDADVESREQARLKKSEKSATNEGKKSSAEISSKSAADSSGQCVESADIVSSSRDTSASTLPEGEELKGVSQSNFSMIPDIPKMSEKMKEMYLNRSNETRCITRPVIKAVRVMANESNETILYTAKMLQQEDENWLLSLERTPHLYTKALSAYSSRLPGPMSFLEKGTTRNSNECVARFYLLEKEILTLHGKKNTFLLELGSKMLLKKFIHTLQPSIPSDQLLNFLCGAERENLAASFQKFFDQLILESSSSSSAVVPKGEEEEAVEKKSEGAVEGKEINLKGKGV